MRQYLNRKDVLNILNIHYKTLYKMIRNKEIDYIRIGNRNKYNLEKYLKLKNMMVLKEKVNICYCRVSSSKQKKDLERQVMFMKRKYPKNEIISEIGSSINFKRIGLMNIINRAINGEINELIITYKDRLARIGYELIEMIIEKYSNGKIIILKNNKKETHMEELSRDILAIMNVYVAKINGMRKYINNST